MDIKKSLKKAYDFVFKEESFLSYVVFIIFSFLVLKFVVYPVFLYIFNLTDIVAVLSPSMVHTGDIYTTYFNWLDNRDINYTDFPFDSGLGVGDAVFVVPAKNISVGDVIVFYPEGHSNTIIHRVVFVNGDTYTTKGDANSQSLDFEKNISFEQVVGKAKFKLPILGWPRTVMYYIFNV